MKNPSTCPKCGVAIPDGAPQGLCPKCVLLGAATERDSAPARNLRPPSVAELVGHFPELEVLELIGAGGMGAVFKARQPRLDRLVALKILSRELADDPAFLARFDREARLLARLNHPNIVTVFDSGVAGPFAYLLMEFVDGVNLRQAMQTGRFKPAEALALVQDVCGALKFAHEKDILHRDIKPENILIDSRGLVKIADFGIAKLVGENEHGNVTLTQQGAMLGSPRYMAPEQFDSPGDVDQRADIYSLGVVLYELLTGELPMGRFAPPSKKSAVDVRIDEIVMRTLERERELRFQTIGEVKTRVEDVTKAGGSTPQARGAETASEAPARKTARFANESFVFTALSVAGGILFLPMIVQLCDLSRHIRMRERDVFWLVSIILILLTVTAGPGMMLAVRALRGIRDAGGRLAGFKRAMVAALTWPSLLVVFMMWVGVSAMLHESGLSAAWRLSVIALLLVASGLGVVMIRQIVRWAKDARPATALSGHVWRFSAMALVALICMGAYIRKKDSSMDAYLKPSGNKLALELNVAAGKEFRFRLIRVDAEGKVTPLELEGAIHAPDEQDLHTTLELVSTERWNESARQQLTATYHTVKGKNYARSVFLDENWKFDTSGKGSSPLMAGERQLFELAIRHDWFGRKLGTLYVEIVGADKGEKSSDPDAARPIAPAPEAKPQH